MVSSTSEHRLEGLAQELLHEPEDVFLTHEAGFDIELRELGLTIRAQILVAEALDDLIVAIEAGHHQQLLHELRRLRQREEVTRLRAARYEIVARALGRRLRQDRRLDVDETVLVHELAQRARDRMAQPQIAQHRLAPQVEVAVTKPQLLADGLVVMERRRLRFRQHGELRREHLDFAAREIRVDGAVRTRTHDTLDGEHELRTQPLGFREHLGPVGIEDDLQQAFAIAQIDENDAAVIAAPVYPTGYRHCPADGGAVHVAAVMTAHRCRPF